MSQTWAQLRLAFLQGAGDSETARAEVWLHLSEGYREVASRLPVPELYGVDDSVVIPSGRDYFEVAGIDLDLYALMDVYNVTGNFPMYPEPAGMTGRNRFLSDNGKPPSGSVTNYQREGSRVWVRNTPSVDTTVRIHVRLQTPMLSMAMVNDIPLTPSQYDMAILFAALENYYNLHPKIEGEGSSQIILSQKYQSAKEAKLGAPTPPRVEEDKAHSETMRLRGYRLRRR